MEKIKGYIDHIIYQNQENGYCVFNLSTKNDTIVCVGTIPYISEGEWIEAEGEYTVHTSYGEQFRIRSFEVQDPEDALAIERYLSSGAIKGVGAALAGRIVRRFKDDTFRIIEEEPERLAEIKGISEKKAREIAAQATEKREVRNACIFLARYGIGATLAVRIFQRYGSELYNIIRENPYRMADEIQGVGFKTADEIARKVGINADSDFRIRSGIFYCLTRAAADGHTYLPLELLTARTGQLLELSLETEEMDHYLMDLVIERRIIVKKTEEMCRVYASAFYYMELNTARMLCDLNIRESCDEQQLLEDIARIEKRGSVTLDEKQKEAVCQAYGRGITILTGGPGTGKTTTINTMISLFLKNGMDIALAAPTGRAAKRMTEATGYAARTIHRLLEVEATGDDEHGSGTFGRNAQNPLEYDVVIIDEMSMVDITLMHALVSAVAPGTRLILVGDPSQLPSVGPGSVLKDIIASRRFYTVTLERIFRQAQESDIVVNAHRINRGEHVPLDNKSKDFFFLKRYDANVIISIVITLVSQKLPGYVHAKPMDIQVLTPTRKGLLGVERLNRILQQSLNPADFRKQEFTWKDTLFRTGDKVMQIRNNYQLEWTIRGKYGVPAQSGTGVFNGDIGIIGRIDTTEETMTVVFDEDREVEYPFSGLEELELAYAITVHKSQGSEYPAVVMPLLDGPRMLLSRNLLYTAITRAAGCVTMVGDPAVFEKMIDNNAQQRRYSSLGERITELAQTD